MKPSSWAPPVWLSFVILICTGVYLVTQWARHPVPGTQVIGPVILIFSGITVLLLLEGVLAMSENLRARGTGKTADIAPEAAAELAQLTRDIVRIVGLALAIPFSWGTIMGLGQKAGIHWSFAPVTLGAVGSSITIACVRLAGSARSLRARGLDKGLEGWNGVIYSNKSDPRVWVPKIGSMGYTLNFARGASWWILALLLSPVVVLVILGLYGGIWNSKN